MARGAALMPELKALVLERDRAAELIAPYITERFQRGDPRWKALVDSAASEQSRRAWRRRLLGWLERFRRTQRGINDGYTTYWAETSHSDQLTKRSTAVPCIWGDEGFLAYPQGPKRVQNLALMRAIEQLAPETVLEVGCGNGLNLLLLAGRFPRKRFTGVELTAAGIAAAKKAQGFDLPDALKDFSPEPTQDAAAHRRVEFLEGNAAKLPFADASFDTVFTSLALEQMEEVRHAALTEIARVTRKHAVLLEPFRDFNAAGLRRDYIVTMDYFSAWIKDLERYGLRPVQVVATEQLPCKLHLGVGLVIAEKI